MFAVDQPVREEIATFVHFNGAIEPEVCDNIIKLHEQMPAEAGRQGMAPNKRICDVRWIQWSPVGGVNSLYRKLADVVKTANDRFWDFHLGGFLEPLQLTHYKAEAGGHYDWHMDRADVGVMMNRKISGTLLLSDDFEGGDLELFDVPATDKLKKGDIILFPSFQVHRVVPLSKGERWSLVFWVTGPPFV